MEESLLRNVLGVEYWVAEFPTARDAMRHACDRMAQERPAVNWSIDGRHFAGWGVRDGE